jgi:predicted NBD/HSP70 family sugar kinase
MAMVISKRRLMDQVDLNDHEKKNQQILDTIRKKGPIARAEISRLIGLNIVTVTSYVDQHIKKGVIEEVGIDVSSGGRKPTLVDLNPNAVYLIGVGLGATDIIAVLCNLKGEIIDSVKKEYAPALDETLVNDMADLVQELIDKSKVEIAKVHGIGIGIPGIVNRKTSSVCWPAGFSDANQPVTMSLHGIFEEKLGIPILVDNDANAAVFGEDWYGRNLGVQHAIYLYSGNGCSFIINGQVYRGATSCAGEWLSESGLRSIDLGIVQQASSSQKENPSSAIYKLVNNDVKKITIHTVVKAAETGDPHAGRILKQAGDLLGRKAALLVNLFNPETVIVGGGVEVAGASFLDAVRQTVKKMSLPEATEKLRIVPSALGENGVSLGAAAFVAQDYFISV